MHHTFVLKYQFDKDHISALIFKPRLPGIVTIYREGVVQRNMAYCFFFVSSEWLNLVLQHKQQLPLSSTE